MSFLSWVLLSLGGVVLLAALLVTSRIRTLTGRVGSFDCRLPVAEGTNDRVTAGIAQYGVGRLDWWRFWSLSVRPARSWQRSELVIVGRETITVGGRTGIYLVRCEYRGASLHLQMSTAAYAGLTSWLESAPPVSHGNVS